MRAQSGDWQQLGREAAVAVHAAQAAVAHYGGAKATGAASHPALKALIMAVKAKLGIIDGH